MIHDDVTKYAGDGISIALLGSTIAGWLPAIASILTMIWAILRIYDAYLSIKERKQRMENKQ